MSSESSSSSLYAGSGSELPSTGAATLPTYLTTSLHDALSSEKLDRCIALQSQTSGLLNARSTSLAILIATASQELTKMKQDFADGAKVATAVTAELNEIQSRIRVCQELAKKKLPVEYHNVRDGLLHEQVEEEEEDNIY